MSSLYVPKYWPAWLGVGLMRLSAFLPYTVTLKLGKGLGLLFHRFATKRRHIVSTNLNRCFPEKDATWQQKMLKAHFISMGMSLMEAPIGWWASKQKITDLTHVQGFEHLQQAMQKGKGVLLFFSHTACPEMIGRMMAQLVPLENMYRPSSHPVMEKVITSQRLKHLQDAIPKSNAKLMIRHLRKGSVICYLADQNVSQKKGVFVNFFNIKASTTPATSRLSLLSGAAVVPLQARRRDDGRGYDLLLYPALEDFPTKDPVVDTQRTIDLVASWVREDIAQYYWLHRRFKARPDGEPAFYSKTA